MTDGEVYGVSDEAHSMSVFMEFPCDVRVASTDRNDRMKQYRCESSASVVRLGHYSFRFVFVVLDDYPTYSAEMEIRQHVARGESGNKEFLGIVPPCVAPENWIRRAHQVGLRFDPDQVVSSI
jgi:hypothetical protein